MSKVKCGLIQMGLKGDGTMSPEKIRDLMIEASIIKSRIFSGDIVPSPFKPIWISPHFTLLIRFLLFPIYFIELLISS